jgi:outer membrane receptor for ferrienterochelin and colicins
MKLQTGAALAVLLAAVPARAQMLDYGALEKLFGEPVTTSVTGSPQRASDVPANMEIITADDIRRSGARTIPDVLRHVAGVEVMEWTNDTADVGVRGYDEAFAHRLLVLIDGRQVYADYYGFTPWSTLPVELADIRQIEIVKGPNSALFGFNAVGGVINIITYNPLYDKINTGSLGLGTQSLSQGSGVITQQFGNRVALRISGGGYHDDDFSTSIPPAVNAGIPRIDDDRAAVDMDGVWRVGNGMQLRLDASHVTSDENQITPIYSFSNAHYRVDSVMGQFDADTAYGLLQAKAYINWLGQLAPVNQVIPSVDFNNQLAVFQLQDIFKLGPDHTFRATLEYRHDSVDTSPFSGGEVSYDVVAVGGMWAWQILPSLSLTNALRADELLLSRSGIVPPDYVLTDADWNRSLFEPSYNSGLVWKADGRDTVRLTAARGVQLPSLVAFGAFVTDGQFVKITGIPDLSPTVVTNYELGWDRALPALDGRFRASLFHQDTYHMVALQAGILPSLGFIPYSTQANVGSSSANGLELELGGKFHTDWRWDLSDTIEEVTDHFNPGYTPDNTIIDFQGSTPSQLVKAHLGWSHGKWEVDGYLEYQSHTIGLMPAAGGVGAVLSPINDYVAIDARAAYRLTEHITLALSAQNLQRAEEQQTSGPDVERRVMGTITVKF